MKIRLFLFGFLLSVLVSSLSAQPKYEFRGVWIATVSNIDWPAYGQWDVTRQKTEFIRILDMHQRNGINAVVVQVRPAADAFYPSTYEPWSQWLTGVQGKAPDPYYDPLAFMIEEAKKRGMEFHAWLNPFRAVFNINSSSVAPSHITRQHPEWFLQYGDTKYFDPSNREAQQFVVNVVRDIVKRYDVDAIHMDDYFYPYPIPGKEFPDQAAYRRSGTTMSRDDWRRSNVDTIIRAISRTIREEKRWCRFGISPFAVWRNSSKDARGSDSKAGLSNYDDLYADILLWLRRGWIDYVTPQLYRGIGDDKIAYEKLLQWWSRNSFGKHVYIGHGIYRGANRESGGWNEPTQLPRQLQLLRATPGVQGSIYFSSKSFEKNPFGWNDSLRNNYYRYPALLPPMSWIDKEKPWPPITERRIVNDSIVELSVKPDPRNHVDIKYYALYRLEADSHEETFGSVPQHLHRIVAEPAGFVYRDTLRSGQFSARYVVTAVGKNNQESEMSEMAILYLRDGKWDFYGD